MSKKHAQGVRKSRAPISHYLCQLIVTMLLPQLLQHSLNLHEVRINACFVRARV